MIRSHHGRIRDPQGNAPRKPIRLRSKFCRQSIMQGTVSISLFSFEIPMVCHDVDVHMYVLACAKKFAPQL